MKSNPVMKGKANQALHQLYGQNGYPAGKKQLAGLS